MNKRLRTPVEYPPSVLPSKIQGGSVEELVEKALAEGKRTAQQLMCDLPKAAPPKTETPLSLQNGHLEELRKVKSLSAHAKSFLRAFDAIDIFFSDEQVRAKCSDPKKALLELEPHFKKYGLKCIQNGSGWAITKNLNA